MLRTFVKFPLFLIALTTLLSTNIVLAAEFTVNATYNAPDADPTDEICADSQGLCTIRAAVEQANALIGPDLVMIPAGKYSIHDENASPFGDPQLLTISDDLVIQGSGLRTTILRNNYSRGTFVVPSTAAAVQFSVKGLTITNAKSGSGFCAVISNYGTATFEDVAANDSNGTVFCNYASMSLSRSTITGTQSRGSGSVSNQGTLTLRDSTISYGTAAGDPGIPSYGGAIINGGVLSATNVTISGNTADLGGAIASFGATSSLEMVNVTLFDNTALIDGNDLYLRDATASAGNTIFAGPGTSNCAFDGVSVLESAGTNIDSGDSCGLNGTDDSSLTQPVLSALGNYGGQGLTHALLDGSPAIDTANEALCPTADQRGEPRPLDGNGDAIARCDIGAHERVYENRTPIADPAGPYNVFRNQPFEFNGSYSYDANPDTLSYAWDFGDGTQGTGVKPTHTYTTLGEFTISLTVGDGQVLSLPALTNVTVLNNPPFAHAGPDQSVLSREMVYLDGTASGDIDGEIVSYEWRTSGGDRNNIALKNADTPTPSFRAPKARTPIINVYEFELTVTDNDGASNSDRVQVLVYPEPLI